MRYINKLIYLSIYLQTMQVEPEPH